MTDGFTHVLWSAGGFVVVLGVLIFIHELGHFSMAKLLGIRVETFSLGFGPRLWGFRRGHTEYRLSAVPLGGYVKMLGENPDEELRGSPEEFLSRKKWERFLVLVMGPAVNIVFAFLVYAALFMVGIPEVTDPPILGDVHEGGPAAAAGLLPGDRILGAGEEAFDSWDDLAIFILMNPDRKVAFDVDREGERLSMEVEIGADRKRKLGNMGVSAALLSQVLSVGEGSPAQAGGLREGDILWRMGGEEVRWTMEGEQILSIVNAHAGKPLEIEVRRGDEMVSLTVVPDPESGTIGISHGRRVSIESYGLVGALGRSASRCLDESALLFRTLKKLFTGSISMRTLSGPLEIASFSGATASTGLLPFLSFMAMVSLQLGLINLFPIPVLDGGHILIIGLEGIARRDFSPVLKERLMMVGVFMLMGLMAVVLYFDVVKLFIPEG